MAQNIDEFKSMVTNFARPTLFRVTFPSIITEQNFSFLCKAANLPASTLGVIEVPYMGRKIKIPGDRTFAEWSLTIQNEQEMLVRKTIEDWSNLINGHETNLGPTAMGEYKHDGLVEQLGVDGGILAAYKLVGCWPSEIGEVDLNFESNDTISEFTCTMSYDYHVRTA